MVCLPPNLTSGTQAPLKCHLKTCKGQGMSRLGPQTSKPPELPGVGGEWEMGIVLELL